MATYFENITLFDGFTVRQRAGVLVSDGHVSWVGAHARAPRDARAAVAVEGRGRTLTPGLIDAHVHLTLDGEADVHAESTSTTPGTAAYKAARNAWRTVQHGVTTVRDLGADGSMVVDLMRAISRGIVDGPRIVPAGKAITITGGHGNWFGREADGPDDVRRAVREQMSAGARAVKVVATGGVTTPGIDVTFSAFTPDELAAAVDEAHRWNFPVAAHAHGGDGALNAVRAGVDSIEHGSFLDTATVKEMKARGTFLVPTMTALREIIGHPDDIPEYAVEKAIAVADAARDSFGRAVRAGVPIACGSDAGMPFNEHGRAAVHEIVHMVESGLPPLRALVAATSNAAKLLRVDAETGSIAVGLSADLCMYDGDPIEHIETVLKPQLVMLGGEVALGSI